MPARVVSSVRSLRWRRVAELTFPSRAGGNFGTPGGGAGVLEFRPDLRAQAVRARDLRGRFASLQTPIREAHHQMAIQASKMIGAELQKRISATGRVQRRAGGGILVDLLMSGRVVDASSDTFVVGGRLLDQSPARSYYRNLETGTRIFVGREFGGAFKSLSGRFYGPSADRFRADPRLIQFGATFSNSQSTIKVGSHGTTRGGVDVGHGKKTESGRVLNRRGFRIVIRNPIPAYHYFLVGGQNYLLSGHVTRTYQQVLKDHGITVTFK
jgi:hypothetical protein